LGKKSGPTAPAAPDPTVVSAAQADANIKTAQEQQRLNMINTTGPYGTVNYAADPNAPGGYSQTTTLSPQEQAIYNLSNQANQGALNVANDQIGRINQALSTPLNLSSLPGLSTGGIQSSFDKGGALQYTFNPGQAVQGSVGGDLDAARQQAIDATYSQATSRLDPRFATAGSQLDTRLANQGLSANSAAYQNAQDQFGREKTDAYNQAQYSAIGAGEDAANALFQRQLGQGNFANAAAGQQYSQNQGQAAFNNTTAGQDYGQNLGAAQFNNQAQDQGFQQSLAARQLDLQEKLAAQNQPINQFATLMGTSGQVSTPQGVNYTPSQVANTDVLGAYALQSQAQQAAYQAAQAKSSGLMGGLFSLGSAALMGSDVRLKKNIERVGTHPNGVGIYEFDYRDRPGRFRGVMAHELETVRPDLVVTASDGMKAVNYFGLEAA
jgi:hypothetical protein